MPDMWSPLKLKLPAVLGHRADAGGMRVFQFWVGLFVGSLLLRLFAMLWVPLLPEEAYYWMYAKNPDFSYFDHPPMVAWVIGLGTSIFGDTTFGVRIVGNLMMCSASVLLFITVRKWFTPIVALIAALALQVLPIYQGVGFIATMDAPLCFFWTLCLLGVTLALRDGKASGWYVAGLAMGGALLSKYTGMFLGFGGLMAVVGHRAWRKQLLSIHPYLAALLALAIFAPVVYWNMAHDWASFRFQFFDRFEGRVFEFYRVRTFMIGETFVLTPIFALAGVWLLLRAIKRPRRLCAARTWFMLSFSVPLLAVVAYKSLRYPVHINWTTPAYLALIPLVAHLLIAWTRQRLGKTPRPRHLAGPTAVGWTFLLCSMANFGVFAFLLFAQPKLQLVEGFNRWDDLADIVMDHEEAYEQQHTQEPLLIADGEYRLASVLAFYRSHRESNVHSSQFTTSQWLLGENGLAYEYWVVPSDWIGRDCLFIDNNNDLADDLKDCFESFEVIDDPRLVALGYQMAICRNYLGPRPRVAKPDMHVAGNI